MRSTEEPPQEHVDGEESGYREDRTGKNGSREGRLEGVVRTVRDPGVYCGRWLLLWPLKCEKGKGSGVREARKGGGKVRKFGSRGSRG